MTDLPTTTDFASATAHARTVITAAADMLAPAIAAYNDGLAVQVALCPGDGTRYGIVFTPAAVGVGTFYDGKPDYRPIDENQAVLSLPDWGVSVAIAAHGAPVPTYVADKINNHNAYTYTAVGVVWALIVGCTVDFVVKAYAGTDEGLRVLGEWKPERFTP